MEIILYGVLLDPLYAKLIMKRNMSFGIGCMTIGYGIIHPLTSCIDTLDGNIQWQSATITAILTIVLADENGYTLLHAVSFYSHMDILEWLVMQQKVLPVNNAVDAKGDLALH